MKQITNWRMASVCDFEADNLLYGVTKIHVMSYQIVEMDGKLGKIHTIRRDDPKYVERVAKFFKYHIDKGIPLVMHNGIAYDVKMVEKVLGLDLSDLMVIDTLALSWYLSPERRIHGLDSFFEDYGIAKPAIESWEQEEGETLGEFLDKMQHRCTEDVKINTALWKDHMERLVDMYTLAQEAIDNGQTDPKTERTTYVGGTRISPDEWIPIDDMVGRHVDVAVDSILTFLMFKMDCAALQEATRWEVDVEHVRIHLEELEAIVLSARDGLSAVMPQVAKYVKKQEPKADPFTKKGDRNAHWVKWDETMKHLDEGGKAPNGEPMVYQDPDDLQCEYRVFHHYEEPNPGSPVQVKDFLFSKGWVPQTFKYEKDQVAFDAWVASKPEGKRAKRKDAWDAWKAARPEERAIPQISVGGDDGKELCHSLLELAEEVPAIACYAAYKVAENRRNTLLGFQRDMEDGKWLKARIGGLTNTLRVKHRELVNLPGIDKPHGYAIRGGLIAGIKKILAGSDMSSLEDRVKHHFMLPHDPEYVKTMQAPDFDPHILMALTAGMVTQAEFDTFKVEDKKEEPKHPPHVKKGRRNGKTCLPVSTTEVLTSEGWKVGCDIVVGDSVLSLNTITGKNEFCKVLDTIRFENSEVVSLGNSQWEVDSTKDHRWLVDRTTGRGQTRRVVREYRTTAELNKACNIVTSAPYTGGASSVTVAQARVLGWVLADGYLDVAKLTGKTSQRLNGSKQHVKMSVAQHPKKFGSEVRDDLDAAGLIFNSHVMSNGVESFMISSPSARKFLLSVGLPIACKHDIDYTKWMLGLSKEALEGFFDAFWKADGNTAKTGTTYSTKVVYQNAGKIADAVHLCCYLLGKTVLNTTGKGYGTVRMQDRSTVTLQKVEKSTYWEDTFCLTTENSNFVIRQGSFITLTGNCNYASVYNAGAPKIAQAAGVDLETGKLLHSAYWKLNWAVKAIAEEQVVIKDARGQKWLVNPINGFCYSLRSEADRFSTLAQGTGSFFFDMWVDNILTAMVEEWGIKVKRLSGSFHDECIICMGDSEANRIKIATIIREAVEKVNKDYGLRRELGCKTQFGERYADIH